MKYYKLIEDGEAADAKNYLVAELLEPVDVDEYMLDDGKRINNWNEVTFGFDPAKKQKPVDIIYNDISWYVVSERMKKLIEDLGSKKVQFLPVNVVDKISKKKLGNYYALNILDPIEGALDMEKSEYLGKEKKVQWIIKYALREEKIKGEPIFKIKENEFAFFVSQDFKEGYEKKCLVGFDFVDTITV